MPFSRLTNVLLAATGALALTACATGPGPVEVTRFHDPAALSAATQGAVFVTAAPGATDTLALTPYQGAVAEQLRALGYEVSGNNAARYRAEVRVDRFQRAMDGGRSPVSVGVGGSTGGYGSGVGLGVGINLGGGGGARIGTELAVTLRDTTTGQSVWEGRAEVDYPARSEIADARANAALLADALFRDFPGNNGETVRVDARR